MELPPRARRIPDHISSRLKRSGTTSACAENTTPTWENLIQKRNYLRVRGEYAGPALTAGVLGELPPRARRIQLILSVAPSLRGTTSACAENTVGHRLPWQSCGELPPRARRILAVMICAASTGGTTSACAENTRNIRVLVKPFLNYLRVRGEY